MIRQGRLIVNSACQRRSASSAVTVSNAVRSMAGIASADRPHVFDRFYRSDKSRARFAPRASGGMGLGLAIAKALVEAMGGALAPKARPARAAVSGSLSQWRR